MTDPIQRPPRSGQTDQKMHTYSPDQLNAELAATRQADVLIAQAGPPMILDKTFVVYQGIWAGLNHTPENKTGYDCSLRLAIYNHVGKNSVNIGGKYFEKVWAFPWIKAPQVYSGMQPNPFESPPSESIFSRIGNWISGRKKQDAQQ